MVRNLATDNTRPDWATIVMTAAMPSTTALQDPGIQSHLLPRATPANSLLATQAGRPARVGRDAVVGAVVAHMNTGALARSRVDSVGCRDRSPGPGTGLGASTTAKYCCRAARLAHRAGCEHPFRANSVCGADDPGHRVRAVVELARELPAGTPRRGRHHMYQPGHSAAPRSLPGGAQGDSVPGSRVRPLGPRCRPELYPAQGMTRCATSRAERDGR